MNKNEQQQFEDFKFFIDQTKQDKDDIFFGAKKVEITDIPGYDAIVSFIGGKKFFVQLTTMSNVVVKGKNKIQHANKNTQNLEWDFTDKGIKDKINYLSKIGVNRKIVKKEDKMIQILDEFKSIFPNEENFDKKYGINSGNLTNALYRSLMKKLNKYDEKDKKKESVLVIIDESPNRIIYKEIVNFTGYTKEQEQYIKKWGIEDYFNYIFKIGITESKFKHIFFDKVQVYFRESNNSEERYHYSNTNLCSNVDFKNNIAMKQIIITPINRIYKRISIIKII